MFATSLALLASAYSGRDRGTAFGLWGATTGAAVAIGPLVGGVLTEGDRLGGDLLRQRADRDRARSRSRSRTSRSPQDPTAGGIDCRAPYVLRRAVPARSSALIRGNAEGWGSALIVGAARSARSCCWSAFVFVERAPSAADARPLAVPQARASSARPIAAFVLSASMFAMFLYLTLYIQNILGYSRAASPACASCR